MVACATFLFGASIFYRTLVYGDPVAGYPSLMVAMLFLVGVQLIAFGVIGEYLGRIFQETKRRPLYLIKRHVPAAMHQQSGDLFAKAASMPADSRAGRSQIRGVRQAGAADLTSPRAKII